MDFKDLSIPFTDQQKLNSFLYLQNFLLEKTQKNEPFFIGRVGGNEPNLCGLVLSKQPISQKLLFEMLTGAGIQVLSNDDVKQYVEKYIRSFKNSNILAVWSGSTYAQAKPFYHLLDNICSDKPRICAQALEPFYFRNHTDYQFPKIFENKKVLIITSHKETTKKQLNKHTTIFNKPIFHESTEFYIYKPPQQNAGNHDSNSWIYHFNIMKNDLIELKKTFDFDIALTSCGGFGMIISDFIYSELKTSVMNIGGGLQIYFGIMGNRWKTHPIISKFVNENWTSVNDEDKPSTLTNNPQLCENSCYW